MIEAQEKWQDREELTKLFSSCYSIDGSVCKLHPVFQPQKAINKLLELGYRKPVGKPPLVSNEDNPYRDKPETRTFERQVFFRGAIAQRELGIKWQGND